MKDIHDDILMLLAQRATEGLDAEDERKLAELLDEHGLEDTLELDLAAAAASNAFALREAEEPADAPAHLKQRLAQDAAGFFNKDNVVQMPRRETAAPRWNPGWAVAAMLAVALFVTTVIDLSPTAPSPAEQRGELLAEASDAQRIEWAMSEFDEYAGVSGDVVWSDAEQEGYMLLANMPVNDPGESQYQLWIVDPDRDANPVDGGVFDIPEGGGPVVIPIQAKLAVDKPVAFAITREKPGGVVVSEGPLLVVASAG